MFFKDEEIRVSGETASDGQLLIPCKNYRGNPSIIMATAATAPTAAASRLRSALSPTAPPFFTGPAASDGSKAGSWMVTTSVAPGVRLLHIENGERVAGGRNPRWRCGDRDVVEHDSKISARFLKIYTKAVATSIWPKGRER